MIFHIENPNNLYEISATLQNSKYARTCTEMFIRAQFLILQNWKKMKMSSTIEWTQRKETVFEVQFNSLGLSRVQLFATPWTAARQAFLPSSTPGPYWNSCPSSQWCHPTFSSPSPPTFNLSHYQGLFKWVSSSHQVAKVLELQLQHQSFQWISTTDFLQNGLVCLLAVQGTCKTTPHFKSINSSVLSFLYSPTLTPIHDTEKTIALTRRTFFTKVMSLLFNMLSRLAIAFLPRSKRPLISWCSHHLQWFWSPRK